MSQLKKGALLSYINIILNIGIGLVLTPFIIRSLGDSEYGLYTLIGSFVAYLSLMDLGLNNTIIRFVSKYRAEKDLEGERQFLGTTMLIYFAISAVLVLLGLVLYFNLSSIFSQSLTPGQIEDAKVMFLILVFNIAVTLPGNSFTAICNAYEHFVFPRSLGIIRYILRAITVVAVLKFGGTAISLVIIDTVFNLVVILFTFYYAIFNLKAQFNFHARKRELTKQIFSYSVWIFIMGVISQFQWNIGQIILGIKVNTVEVAVYAVGIMLGTYYGSFSAAISSLFLPRASKMVLENSNIELTDMMIKVGRVSLVPLMLILTAFSLFGREFIFLWLGSRYEDAWCIALLIMFAYTIPLIQNFSNSIVEANNKVRYRVKVYGISLTIGILFGYFSISKYGGTGMIIGICIGWMLAQLIMNLFFISRLNLDVYRFFKETSSSFILPICLSIFVGILINQITCQGWFYFIMKCFLYALTFCFLIWILGLNIFERKLFFSKK